MDQSESRLRIEFPALVSIQTYLKNLNQILDLMELRDVGVFFRSQSIFKFPLETFQSNFLRLGKTRLMNQLVRVGPSGAVRPGPSELGPRET